MPEDKTLEQEELETGEDEPEPDETDNGESDGEDAGETAPIEAKPEPKHVPLPELLEERKKRQALETRVNQESQQNRVLKDRLETILAKIQEAEQPPPEQPPNYDEDPAAFLKWQNDQILTRQRAEDERKALETQQTQQQRQYEQVRQTIKQGINQFAEATPDYNDAAKYLIDARMKELEVMGVTDQNSIRQRLEQDEIEVGYWAMQQGMSPGEVFYNLAKSRGYAGKPGSNGSKSGTLDNVRRGQQAATSLSKGGGSAGGEITAEALVNMSDDEFLKFTKGKKWAKLHGR